MNTEHSCDPSGLLYIDDHGLDEFDAETAGLTPPRDRNAYGSLAHAHSSLFTVIDAAIRPGPGAELAPVAPKKPRTVLAAALVTGGLATGIVTLGAGFGWWPSAAPTLAASVAVNVDMVALSPPPALAGPAGESVHNVPPVYRKAYIPPVRPAATLLRITEIPGDVDIQAIKRAFASLSSRNVPFERCDVRVVAADRALASCKGKLGNLSSWRMDLTRDRERWQLVPDSSTN